MKINKSKVRSSGLRDIRLLLECTQEEMSSFLNLQQTFIAMIEAGKRNLSPGAEGYFRELKKWLSDAYLKMSGNPVARVLDQKDQTDLKSLLSKKQIDLLFNQRKLALMESQYRDSMNLLDVLTNIEITTVGALRKRHERWLQALIAHQYVKQRKFGLKQQVILKAKVEGIRREMEVLKELV